MLLKSARFIALVLLALLLGVSFTHVLEAGPKGTLAGFFFLDIHQVLLAHYGAVMGAIEAGALLVTLLVVALVRRDRPAYIAGAVSAGALVAMLLAWGAFVYPIDQAVATWTAATLPSDWERYRNRWHLWQAVRAALALVAFGALAVSLLLERRKALFGTPY